MLMYAIEDLLEEVAYLAAVFHWSPDDALDLEHRDRRLFLSHAEAVWGGPLNEEG
jgi:hypothetical protein